MLLYYIFVHKSNCESIQCTIAGVLSLLLLTSADSLLGFLDILHQENKARKRDVCYKVSKVFRSGRISSVYIVGCWLLVVGRHTFSKFVHFKCCSVVMLECKSVRVLECKIGRL